MYSFAWTQRLTDDYLLITSNKDNAIEFIKKMFKLSQKNNFRFNMHKLKTNFTLDWDKMDFHLENYSVKQNVSKDIINWIGISIDTESL